jgi:hypothetical protein
MSGKHRRTNLRMRGLASLAAVLALTGAAAWWTTATPNAAHAADESYRSLNSANHPKWMESVPDATSLAAMSIPGTHETMSIHGGDSPQTQEDYGDSGGTLAAQLQAGIRMIDIRARVVDGNAFAIHHGAFYQQANFDDVLNTAGRFLDENPNETVLMRLKHECTGDLGSCKDVEGQKSFEDIFDLYRDNNAAAKAHFYAPSTDRSKGTDVPTLGDVRGKIVLVVMNGTAGGRMYDYGLSQFADWKDGSSTYVQDEYNVPVIGAIATKRDKVRRFLDQTVAGDQKAMYVNFTSGSGGLFPYTVAAGSSPQQGVNPFLLGYLRGGAVTGRTGTFMMDFPGGGLIDAIIGFNPRKPA